MKKIIEYLDFSKNAPIPGIIVGLLLSIIAIMVGNSIGQYIVIIVESIK